MGDRAWTSIMFSGVVNRDVAERLIAELNAQNCQCDEGPEGEFTVERLTLDSCFYDEQCNYAQMEDVEGFCQESGVTYLKQWAAGGGYGPGFELYNALVGQSFTVEGHEEPAIGASELRACLERGNTLQDVIGYLDKIQNFRKYYPPLEIRE